LAQPWALRITAKHYQETARNLSSGRSLRGETAFHFR
jgi:hypothetical protein